MEFVKLFLMRDIVTGRSSTEMFNVATQKNQKPNKRIPHPKQKETFTNLFREHFIADSFTDRSCQCPVCQLGSDLWKRQLQQRTETWGRKDVFQL